MSSLPGAVPPLHADAHLVRTGPALFQALLPCAVALAAALALHFGVGPALGVFRAKLLADIGIAIIMAVSLNIVNGYTGQFSLGHAGFMAIGGYTAAAITYYGSWALFGSAARAGGFLGSGEWLFCAATLAGGVAAGFIGWLVGLPSLRLRGDYLAIVTLGFGEIVRVLLNRTNDVLLTRDAVAQASLLKRATSLGGPLGFFGVPVYTNIFWVFLFAGGTLIVAYRLKMSSYGRAFLAIREDETVAEMMGVPVFRYKVRAFVVAAFFAGIAGSLYAHQLGTTLKAQELGFWKSVESVIMVVLGGMGSISGASLAAIILTLLPELLRTFAQYRMIIYALLLILMMMLRPKGLFGIYEVWDLRNNLRRRKTGRDG